MASPRRRNRTPRGAAASEARASEAAATALNLRIDANLKRQVSDAAASAGLTLTDYVVKALNHLTDAPYNPWAAHPCHAHGSPRRSIVRGDDIFVRDRALLDRATEQSQDLPVDAGPIVVRLTVPRCLNFGRADLFDFKAWDELCSTYGAAIMQPGLEIRRLHIYDTDKLPPESESRAGTQFRSDHDLEKRLLETSPAAEDRVHFRYTKVSDVMGYPGRRSDREYLNDFNVYGAFAVSFTLETSFGLPYACMVSEFPSDVDYWTQRFDDLFDRGRPATVLSTTS